jgi:hypothetical protein
VFIVWMVCYLLSFFHFSFNLFSISCIKLVILNLNLSKTLHNKRFQNIVRSVVMNCSSGIIRVFLERGFKSKPLASLLAKTKN